MKLNIKKNTRFFVRKETTFNQEKRTLTVRKGTIDKFNKKRAFGSVKGNKSTSFVSSNRFKKNKTSIAEHEKKKVEQTNAQQKKKAEIAARIKEKRQQEKRKQKKKVAGKEEAKTAAETARKLGAQQISNQLTAIVSQEEDAEGVQKTNGAVRNSKRVFEVTKKTKGFLTKDQKFSSHTTDGKLSDLRFSPSKTKRSSPKTPKKYSPKRSPSSRTKSIGQAITKGVKQVVTTMTKTPVGWGIVAGGFLLLLIVGILFIGGKQSSSSSDNGSIYVKHWDGKDAYHSSLLAQRYGIKAEQIDGFIKNEGYGNVDSRATGKEFLRLQALSGIDVRMLVAFAQMESSYGTAGVAKQFPKANIFGYGAFDNDPNQGASWDNTRAVKEFRSTQIDSFGNRTIAIMDDRARSYHNNTLKPGEYVYWTSLEAGKPRAAIAEKLDKWIDDHGGTPDPPGGYGSFGGGGAGLAVLDKMIGKTVSGEFGGETGQCYAVTAYYAHSITPEIILRNGIAASEIGNNYPWSNWKWTVVKNPSFKDLRAGDIINFGAGANMGTWVADPSNGHTGVVGKVLANNQFVLYDQNPGPLKTWTVTFVPGGIASIIHPPK